MTTALLLLGGCSEDSTGPSSNGVIMPLAVGNEWVYKVSFYNSDGTVNNTFFDTLRIYDKLYDGQDTIYAFTNNDRYNSNDVGANRADGYYTLSPGPLKIQAKYPTYSGEVFRIDTLRGSTLDPGTIVMTYSCELTNTTIGIPAGSYMCTKYRIHSVGTYQEDSTKPIENFENLSECWYAPGIGEVKNLFYSWDDSLLLAYKRELVSYHLK